jgi:hypothetical protein
MATTFGEVMASEPTGHSPTDADRIQLINGIFCLFSDNITCVSTWGFYLFDAAFDAERELRNKIGLICVASLLDAIEGADRMLASYVERATELGLSHLAIFCAQADVFIGLIEGVASLYTREEQAFISSVRDQFVHSWLAKRHRDRISIKYFDGKKLTTEELPAAAYHALVRPFYESPEGFEASLTRLVDRFLREPKDYWSAVATVKAALPELQRAMLEGREFIMPGFIPQT